MIYKVLDKIKKSIAHILANTVFKEKIDSKNNYLNIMSDTNLVDEIVNNNKSFARFGDGELSLILNKNFNISFQENSEELNKKLIEVLNSDLKNLIIGINRSFNDPSIYNKKVERYFRTFNFLNREKYKKIIPKDKVYGNSSITRFYIDYDKKNLSEAYKRLNNLRRIWNKRKLLIVEGKHTRLGVGNDLFDNSKSIRRIIVPEKNAFNSFDEIIDTVKKHIKKDEMVLLAVGPTATVLTYELAKNDIQAVDVGHIDIEYEWLKMKTDKRVAVKGKYVNEIKGDKYTESEFEDESYNKSIVSVIENK